MATRVNNPANGQIVFADFAADFSSGAPATASKSLIVGAPTQVQLDLGGVSAATGRASAKFDFGDNRAALYRLDGCIDTAAITNSGDAVDIWIAGSANATAGSGNPAGLTGVDAAWTHSRGDALQMTSIGPLFTRADTTSTSFVGFYRPTHRYGILVLQNSLSGVALLASAADMHLVLTPIDYLDQ